MLMTGAMTQPGIKPSRPWRRTLAWLLPALLVLILCFLRWGGYLLVSSDPLPSHADVTVALQGSITAQLVRLDGAMQLLKEGVATRALVSVPKQSYWGEAVPPVARHYLEDKYGPSLAGRVDFCETGAEIDSTEQEAAALLDCIRAHGWKSIIVVTSDYHTRRAGLIWRKVLQKRDPADQVWIHGVPDPDFQPQGWWRKRRYAKTWFLEFTKLAWECLFGWEE